METLTFDSSVISLLIFNGKQKMENYFSSKAWSEDGNSPSFSARKENLFVSAFSRILSGCMDIKQENTGLRCAFIRLYGHSAGTVSSLNQFISLAKL